MSTSAVDRLLQIRQKTAALCVEAGRPVDAVRILPVSKNHPAEAVRELYAAGERAFAENRVQEMVGKAALLPADIEWHLIGPLQSNKVRQAVRCASVIHSVDSLALIERLGRIAAEESRRLEVLLQISVSGEDSKSGADPALLPELLAAVTAQGSLSLRGLMTIGVQAASADENLAIFHSLRQLRDRFSPAFPQLRELSMGMSGDMPEAIRAGASVLRIGTAIFGQRDYGRH